MHILLYLLPLISTLLGGWAALRFKDQQHLILGLTAGVLLGVVTFDILPEVSRLVTETHTQFIYPMIALVVGFLVFHIFEKVLLIHHAEEASYGAHTHPTVGIASALALAGHSFLDGIGIGLAFQVSSLAGVAVAVAVIAHDFSDGLNTVSLMVLHKNKNRLAKIMLFFDALAPILGAISTLVIHISEKGLLIYLGFFAGFLLYIGASEFLPEAHSQLSSY